MSPDSALRSLAVVACLAAAACGGDTEGSTGDTSAGGGAGSAGASAGSAGTGTAGGNTAGTGTAGTNAAGTGTAGSGTSGSGTSGSGGGAVTNGCTAGADCVPGEWCSPEVPGSDYCECPTTKPSTPVTLGCGLEYPLGKSHFVCYDPVGAPCLVPGPEVADLLSNRITMDCAQVVSAGANTVKTSAGAGPRCCYMVLFSGCK